MNTLGQNEIGQAKKAYHSPVVHYYGAIRTITESVGNMGASDGGGVFKMTKTAA